MSISWDRSTWFPACPWNWSIKKCLQIREWLFCKVRPRSLWSRNQTSSQYSLVWMLKKQVNQHKLLTFFLKKIDIALHILDFRFCCLHSFCGLNWRKYTVNFWGVYVYDLWLLKDIWPIVYTLNLYHFFCWCNNYVREWSRLMYVSNIYPSWFWQKGFVLKDLF